jgi:outer membrane protein assembly factor BamE (lipoprotein component of BamABCDE complex)
MKKITTLLYAGSVACALLFSGCSKDKEDDPAPTPTPTPTTTPVVAQPTKKEIITAKTWKTSIIKGNGIDITNQPSVADLKNLRTKFNMDGTWTQNTSNNQTDSGIWEFQNSETRLVFDPGTTDQEQWDITELKDNSLKMRSTFTDGTTTMLVEWELVYAQ